MTTTHSRTISPAVTAFLALLAQANAVVVDSPVLTHWDVSDPTGEPDNEVALFSWEDTDGAYSIKLTEGGIEAGSWTGASFFCCDHEGDEVQLSLYRHLPIRPTSAHPAPAMPVKTPDELLQFLLGIEGSITVSNGVITAADNTGIDLRSINGGAPAQAADLSAFRIVGGPSISYPSNAAGGLYMIVEHPKTRQLSDFYPQLKRIAEAHGFNGIGNTTKGLPLAKELGMHHTTIWFHDRLL